MSKPIPVWVVFGPDGKPHSLPVYSERSAKNMLKGSYGRHISDYGSLAENGYTVRKMALVEPPNSEDR